MAEIKTVITPEVRNEILRKCRISFTVPDDCDRYPNTWINTDQLAQYTRAIEAAVLSASAGKVDEWLPIESAPEGELVVCMWLDKDDAEHPARFNFDYFEDGIWMNYFSEHEHYAIAGVANGRSEDAPYTHYVLLPSTHATAQQAIEQVPQWAKDKWPDMTAADWDEFKVWRTNKDVVTQPSQHNESE